ncbi:MAG TPA: serine/threonine-protein kinase [Polyangiaceae bacterium LLY-WYZ-15_(1-7)]|nr:hypothetical protein [Sandaracinus sp.]HJL02477.1 serine/threonine-protein kinase [Polyangiaceae bacterium LLY-WYZ-15_(1-7)]HJL12260.1 serine/threonine-protein kinase [Polyangiaceae bacterium LLY-WYZ-15_(1-7)]HJL26863.1 serine/threonine-protein kinase [Polyangiaceae bacterium LLY-WYZ-15_(1-7)]HJL36575.1 serine/threonine-protein kinase [Polyangiaceae bacterium LLY-WYZ-15_(1-7)]
MTRSSRLSSLLRRAPTRYRPVSRIAAGGMAEVWRAEAIFEEGGTHEVAIKRVLPQMGQPLFRAMFEDEARLGMLLRHPNIVRVYDARDVGGTFIMVMELVDGDTLKGLLEKALERGAPMPLGVALHIARELARALDYVHRAEHEDGRHLGIVHRDVSPHNLLLGRDGAVKLTDFGLADANVHEHAQSEDLVGGKLGYLAPEIVLQKGSDHRIDLFAAAVTLWEMLAGRRLFQGADDAETVRAVARCEVPSLRKINGRVPREVDDLVGRMLRPSPDERLPTARSFFEALDVLVTRLDREVGAQDVALLIGLHLARKQREKPKEASIEELGVAELLADELAQFAAGGGAKPLDPREFDYGVTSGVRRHPRPWDD